MGSSPGGQPSLKVDPELLAKYGGQLLSAAEDLPEAPPPFTVTGTDAISQAIAEKLLGIEDPIQQQLPQLKNDASDTANKVVSAAGRYSDTDAQIASNYEKLQFGSAGGGSGAGAAGAGGGGEAMGQMGQMMSMPMQMASQAAQMPMQAMSALGQVPQGIMQGVQQIGQMAGGLGGGASGTPASEAGAAKHAEATAPPQDDRRDPNAEAERDEKGKHEAAAGDEAAERAPEPAAPPASSAVPQQGSPRHAAPDPRIDL